MWDKIVAAVMVAGMAFICAILTLTYNDVRALRQEMTVVATEMSTLSGRVSLLVRVNARSGWKDTGIEIKKDEILNMVWKSGEWRGDVGRTKLSEAWTGRPYLRRIHSWEKPPFARGGGGLTNRKAGW